MSRMSIEQFANELGVLPTVLLEQLRAAGVSKRLTADCLTEKEKTQLLDYLRLTHGAKEEKGKINLPRRQASEIKKLDNTDKPRSIQVELRKKLVIKGDLGVVVATEISPIKPAVPRATAIVPRVTIRENLAKESLNHFDMVAEAARKKLCEPCEVNAEAFISMNTMTSVSEVQQYTQIRQKAIEGYQKLLHEPAIARVAVEDNSGNISIYFICRATPLLGMASYLSPVGRLASIPVGESLRLPNGMVKVIERARLHPTQVNKVWDSLNTVLEAYSYSPATIASLRAFLPTLSSAELEDDSLIRFLGEERELLDVSRGIRRSIITKMELRDQPILDPYQDEIFRLPLDKRLLILGPAGTGKTTALIRRLNQKLDIAFLDEAERRIVEGTAITNELPHDQSWLMFAPTELLRQKLKETFAREGVAASDRCVRTWSDYRRELARNVLGVLQTGSGRGALILKDKGDNLEVDVFKNASVWYNDFETWQRDIFVKECRSAAQALLVNAATEISVIGQRLFSVVDRIGTISLVSTLISLNTEVDGIRTLLTAMKEFTDKKIQAALNLQWNRNKLFIDELASFIDSIQEIPNVESADIEDDEDDEDEEIRQQKTSRAKAASAYKKAIRAQARMQVGKRNLDTDTSNGKIIEWLRERTLSKSELADVGTSLLVQANLRPFLNPVKKYLDGIPSRYKAFRRLRQTEAGGYRKEMFARSEIHPLELDIVLLVILRNGSELLSNSNIVRDIDKPFWSALKPIQDLFRNQILIDEVTDFSPVQIACMAALSNPRIRSFFACGDFHQRLTTWGSRSIAEIQFAFPEIEVKEITVGYRQSRQLNELAKAIILVTSGKDHGVTLPPHVDSEGVPPVLLENAPELEEIVQWLNRRIKEIEFSIGKLPSIAIFVGSEGEIPNLADRLNLALSNISIRVVACPNGQVMGQDNDIRVFDVQHIKGLEFEAVFFIGIDRLATMHPLLFDKYLYVGATRAATYLGLTCDGGLPQIVSELRSMFTERW